MKTIINRMRWLSAGITLGMWFMAWCWAEDDKKKSSTDKEFNDIINKYNDPEWISEKMYGEDNA